MIVKLSDVAKRAGVSAMTASRVINGRGRVSETTRAAVQAAVADLGYSPNLAARSLASHGVDRVGLLYSNPSASYLGEFLIGALEGAQQLGAMLAVERCADDAASEVAAIRRLAAGGIRGLILPPPHGESVEAVEAALSLGLRVVAVATGSFHSQALSVRIDDRAAAGLVARHFLDLGHRRFGVITGPANQSASAERLAGFRDEIARVDPALDVTVVAGDFTHASGLAAGGDLLDRARPPTAIFAGNDDMAAGVIAAARARGLDAPGDLSVAGFDDTPLATTLWPPLTTLRQPVAEMARAALEMIRSDAEPGSERLYPHQLVVRGSTAPPPVDRPVVLP